MPVSINDVPREVLTHMFQFLRGDRAVYSVPVVSKTWKKAFEIKDASGKATLANELRAASTPQSIAISNENIKGYAGAIEQLRATNSNGANTSIKIFLCGHDNDLIENFIKWANNLKLQDESPKRIQGVSTTPIQTNSGKVIVSHISGQDIYRTLKPNYFRGQHIILLFLDPSKDCPISAEDLNALKQNTLVFVHKNKEQIIPSEISQQVAGTFSINNYTLDIKYFLEKLINNTLNAASSPQPEVNPPRLVNP